MASFNPPPSPIPQNITPPSTPTFTSNKPPLSISTSSSNLTPSYHPQQTQYTNMVNNQYYSNQKPQMLRSSSSTDSRMNQGRYSWNNNYSSGHDNNNANPQTPSSYHSSYSNSNSSWNNYSSGHDNNANSQSSSSSSYHSSYSNSSPNQMNSQSYNQNQNYNSYYGHSNYNNSAPRPGLLPTPRYNPGNNMNNFENRNRGRSYSYQ